MTPGSRLLGVILRGSLITLCWMRAIYCYLCSQRLRPSETRGPHIYLSSIILGALLFAADVRAEPTTETDTRKSAELKIHVMGPMGSFTTSPLYIRVAAAGAPPSTPSPLADESGLNNASVVSSNKCKNDQKLHSTRAGEDVWCLEVRNLAPGSDSTAEILNDVMTLKLTVGARHHYIYGPTLATVVSIALGAWIAQMTSRRKPIAVSFRKPTWRCWALWSSNSDITFTAALLLVVVAIFSTLSLTYFPNQTFGTWIDYLALCTSGFGSSFLATIGAALLLSRRHDQLKLWST